MADKTYHVFLSHSRNDPVATGDVFAQLRRQGLDVFNDDESIQPGDEWLVRLQSVLEGCGAFVVLVGRDGVRRWVGAEAQVALNRHFGPHDDARRLPIFPILLDGIPPETLPPLLRLFQVTRWTPGEALPADLLSNIRDRNIVLKAEPITGCPFVGLASYRPDQAHLFFGRRAETLDALACFRRQPTGPRVKWLEISGSSGSGKSSLMQAGLLPLIDRGWLWPRTGFAHWRRIGPMMPGARPVEMLAEALARAWQVEMADVNDRLKADGDAALAHWLRTRKQDDSAFLLAIDQFEELFTFADAEERCRFDRLLAAALEDPECPLFVLSTVRADFLDRFAGDLPRLVAVQNRLGKSWKLAPISADGLREVIDGPARLANLDVGEIQEAMVAEARDEAGALPLVENALYWLWDKRTDGRLSGKLLGETGGVAGILSRCADDLLAGLEPRQRDRALELLFRLVQVDPEGRRHARRRIPLEEAIAVVGGGEVGRGLVHRLAGERARDGGVAGPLRLITVTEEAESGATASAHRRSVNLIHETLIRSKGLDAAGKPQPYWPTLWSYIEKNKDRAARRERLQLMAREWKEGRGLSRYFTLAGWSSLFGFRGLAAAGSLEKRYLGWSQAKAAGQAIVLATVLSIFGESVYWALGRGAQLEGIVERWSYILGATPSLPKLVKIPAGSFLMGSEGTEYYSGDLRPVHVVRFAQPFYLGETEVTFREWDACVADGGCGYRPADQGWGRDVYPVINVSWQDAQTYVAWLSRKMAMTCRLPSEAEWEYAASARAANDFFTESDGEYAVHARVMALVRAGAEIFKFSLPAPNGSDDIQGKALANCTDCGSQWDGEQTAPVKEFPANAWGLYAVHGNVGEWVEDCWHRDYEGAPDDGRAWDGEDGGNCKFRVLRGGSWDSPQDDARSAARHRSIPRRRIDNIGFRVVCLDPSFGH